MRDRQQKGECGDWDWLAGAHRGAWRLERKSVGARRAAMKEGARGCCPPSNAGAKDGGPARTRKKQGGCVVCVVCCLSNWLLTKRHGAKKGWLGVGSKQKGLEDGKTRGKGVRGHTHI